MVLVQIIPDGIHKEMNEDIKNGIKSVFMIPNTYFNSFFSLLFKKYLLNFFYLSEIYSGLWEDMKSELRTCYYIALQHSRGKYRKKRNKANQAATNSRQKT